MHETTKQQADVTLPALHQIGDYVACAGITGRHMISAIMFTENKVYYHVAGVLRASDDVREASAVHRRAHLHLVPPNDMVSGGGTPSA